MARKKFTREIKGTQKPRGIDAFFAEEDVVDDQNKTSNNQKKDIKNQKEPKTKATFLVKMSTLHNLRAYAYKHRMKNSEFLDLCVTKYLSEVDSEDLKDALEMYETVG